VGFAFYMPDPILTAWTKEDKRLKKRAWRKKDRLFSQSAIAFILQKRNGPTFVNSMFKF